MSQEEIIKIQDTIKALEQQRSILGDTTVDTALLSLNEQLNKISRSAFVSAPAEAERKLVTVMFADISGFTALSEKMDPEQVRFIINECFGALVPVLENFGGYIDKFIGDEIMALFGAPVAQENHAESALRAAWAMMKRLDVFNSQFNIHLGLHFGINTGLVVAGGLGAGGRMQYSVMGDTVNLAARLEGLSDNGEILIGENTFKHTAGYFDFQALPPVIVKGKAEPVQVYKLLKPLAEAERNMVFVSESPFAGRKNEYATLTSALSAFTIEPHPLLMIINGQVGIGKTRIVKELKNTVNNNVFMASGQRLVSYQQYQLLAHQ